jgi:DNA-binding CsgD family transcriptional regulator
MSKPSSQLRRTGIGVVGEIPWGTHFCHFYETKNDLLDILIPYFKTGLELNEACVLVVSSPLNEGEAKAALRRAVPRLDQHLAAGDIEILTHAQVYLKDGKFNEERAIACLKEKLAWALDKGYAGIRANGSRAWLTRENWKRFLGYEKKLNKIVTAKPLILLCAYPLGACRAADLFLVARSHGFTMARCQGRREVLQTPELRRARATIKRLKGQLKRLIGERSGELAAVNANLKRKITAPEEVENKLLDSGERLRVFPPRQQSLCEERCGQFARKEVAKAQAGLERALLGKLTSRERQIARLVAEATSNKQIAGLLNISLKTVETHRSNLMAKLGLHSVSELVRYAIRNHLIEP